MSLDLKLTCIPGRLPIMPFFLKPFGVSLGDVWFFLLLIVDGILSHIQTKATEQYFPVVLFIMLYKVILTFESVDEILKCDHSNESY